MLFQLKILNNCTFEKGAEQEFTFKRLTELPLNQMETDIQQELYARPME